ncbi:hypothetical protein HPP92_028246 [Vanilla planifolia]|uniref:Uncharacterized protein n=1 Tax=Vanilla planifolia TaxID=51239 RepID=A0A835P6B1_VANPL|nr:hypothetical protein HPP92_028246 [Vanilla planifolia]
MLSQDRRRQRVSPSRPLSWSYRCRRRLSPSSTSSSSRKTTMDYCFSLGGVVFGTLAYVFDPQLRRYILNEDEYGFRRPRRLVYYEDESGLEKARQTLNWKIRQLNFAIDRVSLRLRGEKEMPDPESIEANSWFGATL